MNATNYKSRRWWGNLEWLWKVMWEMEEILPLCWAVFFFNFINYYWLKHFFLFILFIFYFWLHWVFIAARGLSLVAASRGYSALWCAGFLLRWLLLSRSTGFRCVGFSSCGTWGLVTLRHVESSRTRARTRVPCIGRRILNHCTTREVLLSGFEPSPE